MRGRKHPLEIYQRASPFEGWEEEEAARKVGSRPWWRLGLRRPPVDKPKAPKKPPRQDRAPRRARPAAEAGPGSGWRIRGVPWTRFFRNKAAGAVRRARRIPLRTVVWAVSPLVLAILVFYAVQFWPAGGEGGAPDTSIRNDWRVPPTGQQDQETARAPLFFIQLKRSSILPASDDPEIQARHQSEVQTWLEERTRLDDVLQRKLQENGLVDLGLSVDAWHSDMVVQSDVRLVIGGWEQKDDQVLSLHNWLKDNGFEDAQIIQF